MVTLGRGTPRVVGTSRGVEGEAMARESEHPARGVPCVGLLSGSGPAPRHPMMAGAWRRCGSTVVAAVVLVALAAVATSVDCRLSSWMLGQQRWAALLRDALRPCELFGHGLVVVLIVGAVHQLDPARRWALPRMLGGAWLSGIAANVVKMCIVRIRPHHFQFDGTVWETFGQWLPLASAGSGGQSFPSGHAATAFGLAAVLAWLYPRGRRFFWVMAVLVACQRVASGAHYLSDVLVGAAIGLLVGRACTLPWRPWNWLDRWETVWRGLAASPSRSAPMAPAGRCASDTSSGAPTDAVRS